MKKIIILSLVAATHMFAFEVSEAEIISKNDQTYSKVILGDTSFEYASSKDNKALFTQKYCDNGDEGYSVVLSNDSVDFKMQYDSCTGETSIIKAGVENKESTKVDSVQSASETVIKTFTSLYKNPRRRNLQGYSANTSRGVTTYDQNGNSLGKGIIISDINNDGINDYTYKSKRSPDTDFSEFEKMKVDSNKLVIVDYIHESSSSDNLKLNDINIYEIDKSDLDLDNLNQRTLHRNNFSDNLTIVGHVDDYKGSRNDKYNVTW